MRTGYQIEQVFVRAKAGRTEVSLVMVAPSGAIKHETLQALAQDKQAALEQAARVLAFRPDLKSVRGARLRVEAGGRLEDDPGLLAVFVAAFREARR
ncbi:hypothetical protein BH24DEI1_BH24DEI1_20380 [soil metagenome]